MLLCTTGLLSRLDVFLQPGADPETTCCTSPFSVISQRDSLALTPSDKDASCLEHSLSCFSELFFVKLDSVLDVLGMVDPASKKCLDRVMGELTSDMKFSLSPECNSATLALLGEVKALQDCLKLWLEESIWKTSSGDFAIQPALTTRFLLGVMQTFLTSFLGGVFKRRDASLSLTGEVKFRADTTLESLLSGITSPSSDEKTLKSSRCLERVFWLGVVGSGLTWRGRGGVTCPKDGLLISCT